MARRKAKSGEQPVENQSELTEAQAEHGSNGNGPEPEMLDLNAMLAEISGRLIAAGSTSLPHRQSEVQQPIERKQSVVFILNNQHYAFEISRIREVLRLPEITRVPGLPDWLLGVMNVHGEIVSVVDLAYFLGIKAQATSYVTTVLVAQTGDQQIGLSVDDVEQIHTFPVDLIGEPLWEVEPTIAEYLQGTFERTDHFIHLLDCDQLLHGSQMQQFT
ncbi:MAG: chemotaxis protein CheW [Anaerolineae bacterium]|nr:chemotaxis protein CheW [Anaerolineae bacterium]